MSAFLANASSSDGGGAALVTLLAIFAFAIVVFIGWWKIFEKAGEAGWKAIIPIYNVWILLKTVGRPGWWIVLMLIPCVNLVMLIIVYNDLAKSFGKGPGFTVGLVLLSPIFSIILGWGDARYLGPAGPEGAVGLTPPPPPPPPPTA